MSVFKQKPTNDYWSLGWRIFQIPNPRWYLRIESAVSDMPNFVTLGTPWKTLQVSFSYESIVKYYIRIG
jgi:hypothetical protein